MGGGGKGGSPSIKPSPLDKEQAAILKNLEATVGVPIRNIVVPQAMQTLGGPGVFQTSLPAPDREAIEGQYKQAQNQIMNTGTRGGQLQSRLADLSRDRASDVAGATNQARQLGIERSLGMVNSALPNYGQQLSARSAAAQNDTERRLANAKMQASNQSAMGSGLGGLLGLAGGFFK